MTKIKKRTRGRAALATGLGVLAATGSLTFATTSSFAASVGRHSHPHDATVVFRPTWKEYVDAAAPIAMSSPVLADLEGTPVAVVGDLRGYLYALNLADGEEIPNWPVRIGNIPIQSSPSVNGSTVYLGAGSAADPDAGGYYAFRGNGTLLWHTTIRYTPSVATTRGVEAGLAVGDLQGSTAVVAGSLGQYLDALKASSGHALAGFPWFAAAPVFTTAALADLYNNGQTDVIEGGASAAGHAFNVAYADGGHIRVLAATGNAGAKAPNGGLDCQYNTNQVVQGSPAVGPFLAGRTEGIVAGTGTFFPGASDTDKVIAVTSYCALAWSTALDGTTSDSPALVEAKGNTLYQVAEGTSYDNNQYGTVYLLDGRTGRMLWRTQALGAVVGGITSVDLGGGYQDLVVPTLHGVEILDGKTGAVIDVLERVVGVQDSPLVTDDPNETIGITIAGYKVGGTTSQGQAVVEHFELAGSDGALATEAGSWPEFHHDPQLTGNATN